MASSKLRGRRGAPVKPHVCHPPPKPVPPPPPVPPLTLHVEWADPETYTYEPWDWQYDNPYRAWYDEAEHPETVTVQWLLTETNPDPTPSEIIPDGDWNDCLHEGQGEYPNVYTTRIKVTDGTNTAQADHKLITMPPE